MGTRLPCPALSEYVYSTRTELNVWVSSGSHDKMTQTRRLRTTDIHSPQVLETRCLRSRGPRAELPAESPGEGPSRLFQLLGAPGIRPWAGGRLPPVSASVSTWFLLCVRVCVLRWRERWGRVQECTLGTFVIQLLEISFLVLHPGSLA